MKTERTRAVAALLIASMTIASLPAEAHEELVSVQIKGDDPRISYRLLTRDRTLVATCETECTLQVPRGSYILRSSETDELRATDQRIKVDGDTVVTVSPGSRSKHSLGLTTAILGTTAFGIGLVGTAMTAMRGLCTHNCDSPNREEHSFTPWLLTLGAGAFVGTAGWLTLAGARSHVTASPLPTGFTVSAAPTPGGGFIGATMAF